MINFKKMDDKDFVFINRTPGAKEDKAFSEFLKSRREKILRTKKKKKAKKAKNSGSTALAQQM